MALIKSAPSCPECTEGEMFVIEIRKTPIAMRRRRQCNKCKHRMTSYEIEQSTFEELKQAKDSINKILKALKLTSPPLSVIEKSIELVEAADEVPCYDCANFKKLYGCSFDFPEALTEDAKGCIHFDSIKA